MVAGIIAVLAAILSSVLVGAKASGKKASCIGNLSQIGKALTMYATDSDGLAPPYLTRSIKSGTEVQAFGSAEIWRASLLRYAGGEGVFYCPSDTQARTNFEADCFDKANSLFTSYETTPIVNGEIGENKSVVVSVDSPKFENIAYLQDRICMGRNLRDGSLTQTSYHGDRMTVLFMDSHVKHITITDKK